jgi:hypothetical protein
LCRDGVNLGLQKNERNICIGEVTLKIRAHWSLSVIELIVRVFEIIPVWVKDHKEKADQVLAALYTALNETIIYANRLPNQERNYESEEQLSRLWFKAAMAVRRVDGEFAEKCLVFGEYWAGPTEGVVNYAIKHKCEVEEAFKKLRELMRSMA